MTASEYVQENFAEKNYQGAMSVSCEGAKNVFVQAFLDRNTLHGKFDFINATEDAILIENATAEMCIDNIIHAVLTKDRYYILNSETGLVQASGTLDQTTKRLIYTLFSRKNYNDDFFTNLFRAKRRQFKNVSDKFAFDLKSVIKTILKYDARNWDKTIARYDPILNECKKKSYSSKQESDASINKIVFKTKASLSNLDLATESTIFVDIDSI